MSLKLSTKQRALLADCSCPLPQGIRRVRLSTKAIITAFIIFAGVVLLLWALWPPGALWLLAIYGVLTMCTFIYRLIRGHTVSCAIKWSPIAALYTVGDGIASVTP